jgi:hypothetical protein
MTTPSQVLESEGRSPSESSFELRHVIDGAGVDQLRLAFSRLVIAPRAIRVACDRVTGLDPVGVALLWLLCRNLEQSVGTRIRLAGLGEDLVQKLRSHPLRDYLSTGEEIFEDPFASQWESHR